MYVYRIFDDIDGVAYYKVGYYNPDGDWCEESEHSTGVDARRRIHYLNGGSID